MAYMKKFEHLKIHLEAIKSATNNFAEESCIGRGGFGKVYKGEIAGVDGQPMVALKRLDPKFGQGDPEFWKEIMMLSQYKHKNIVSLLGFCDDCGEKILVYEYVPNGSLDYYLNSENLKWIQRLKLCIGAAHGLAYLHNANGTQQRVFHRDIKSSNILLNEDWNAKISDFGLSKLGPANQQYTFLISKAVGTPGYCDPLYVEHGYLTKESDVYSFGVVLFEVLCGRLCIDNKNESLISLVRQSYKQKTINQIVYDNIKDEINPDSLQVFVTIAYNCIKRDREERPLMGDIVRELESALRYQELRNDQIAHIYIPPKPSEVLDSDRGKKDEADRRTMRVDVEVIPPKDGYEWRKYGQKELPGSRFPRGYYNCTHQKLYNCPAKKRVQRLDNDPYTFEVTYRGEHTCTTLLSYLEHSSWESGQSNEDKN